MHIDTLVQAAGAAAAKGRWQDAELLWRKVLSVNPRHAGALHSLGVHAFQRGQLAQALQLLNAAHAAEPGDPMVLLTTSIVLREMGNSAGELAAIQGSLVADQYFLPGLLAKASHMERHGRPKAAAAVYRDALKIAPPERAWPTALRTQLQHARATSDRFGRELAAFLAERTGARMGGLAPTEAERWREAGAILSGQSQAYPSQATRLQVPRLAAIPFFDRASFAWAEAVEARTGAITAELHAALAREHDQFTPYVAYEPGAPVNQWHELNHSQRWSSYFLWRNGQPIAEHLQQCPETAAALALAEMADIGGQCPNAMFSALAPHTHIPPHHGETNARVVVHLPLVVPDNCLYRVGFEQRRWKVGELLVFDDSIEHEARNDSDELRVILIFDAWNPLLSVGERDMVRAISAASAEFNSLG